MGKQAKPGYAHFDLEVWFNTHRTKGSTNLWFELAARRLIVKRRQDIKAVSIRKKYLNKRNYSAACGG
jgi:hypothetical protein